MPILGGARQQKRLDLTWFIQKFCRNLHLFKCASPANGEVTKVLQSHVAWRQDCACCSQEASQWYKQKILGVNPQSVVVAAVRNHQIVPAACMVREVEQASEDRHHHLRLTFREAFGVLGLRYWGLWWCVFCGRRGCYSSRWRLTKLQTG